jgi:hypothetical protein
MHDEVEAVWGKEIVFCFEIQHEGIVECLETCYGS